MKSWLALLAPYLAHWGVVLDPAQVDGPDMPDPLSVYFDRLNDVLNQLTTLTNGDYLWEITYDKRLRMFAPATTPAPFDVVDGDQNTIGDVTVAPSITTFATRILLLFGDGLHDVTETFVGDGTTASFPLGNWVAATRGYVTANPPGYSGPDVNEPIGATAPPYWTVDNAAGTLTRTPAPVAGTAISFTYTAQFPTLVYADPPGGIPDPPGLWEQLVREPDVFDRAIAQAHANTYILQASTGTTTIKYRTLGRGVHPGQLQNIARAARHLDAQCLITDVEVSDTDGRTYRAVTAVASTIPPGETWRDIIKSWGAAPSSASGSFAQITSGGGDSGGGVPIGPGTAGHLAKWLTASTIGDSLIAESGTTITVSGDVVATSYTGSGAGLTNLPASALTGTISDARLSANVALKNAPLNAFTGNMTIAGTLGVTGATTLGSLVVTTTATVGGSLGVTGTTTLGVLNAGAATLASLGVTGAATVGGTLLVAGVITAPAFKASPASAGAPGELYLDGNSGLTLYSAAGAAYNFAIRQPSGGVVTRVPTGTTNIEFAGALASIGYVSGLTGWRITAGGSADFRVFSADTLQAQTFVVDQTRALAGSEIIAKSVAVLAAAVVVPAYSAAVTITVTDLADAPGMPVFAPGNWVVLRVFSRSGGALTIDNAVGQVSAPATGLPGNTQTWTFTRGTSTTGGTLAGGSTVPVGGAVIDYGASGSGYYEVQGADGTLDTNGPYAQIVTWVTAPVSANRTLRTRFGNLFGITSVANEYGMIAGTYAATNGQYFRAEYLGVRVTRDRSLAMGRVDQHGETRSRDPVVRDGIAAPRLVR